MNEFKKYVLVKAAMKTAKEYEDKSFAKKPTVKDVVRDLTEIMNSKRNPDKKIALLSIYASGSFQMQLYYRYAMPHIGEACEVFEKVKKDYQRGYVRVYLWRRFRMALTVHRDGRTSWHCPFRKSKSRAYLHKRGHANLYPKMDTVHPDTIFGGWADTEGESLTISIQKDVEKAYSLLCGMHQQATSTREMRSWLWEVESGDDDYERPHLVYEQAYMRCCRLNERIPKPEEFQKALKEVVSGMSFGILDDCVQRALEKVPERQNVLVVLDPNAVHSEKEWVQILKEYFATRRFYHENGLFSDGFLSKTAFFSSKLDAFFFHNLVSRIPKVYAKPVVVSNTFAKALETLRQEREEKLKQLHDTEKLFYL